MSCVNFLLIVTIDRDDPYLAYKKLTKSQIVRFLPDMRERLQNQLFVLSIIAVFVLFCIIFCKLN